MNSRVVSFQDEIMLLSQENVVFPDDLSLQCGARNPEFFGRGSDNGPGLQHNDPVVLGDVIWMNRYVVTRNFSSEDTHVRRPLPWRGMLDFGTRSPARGDY